MNVAFEPLPNCLANLRIEVDPPDVEKKLGEVASQYTKLAKLPVFRQGKAPRAVVEKKFNKEIREEVTKQVLSDACRSAIQERKLRVLSLADVEDVEWGDDKSLKFRATLVLQPEFDIPDYKGIPVTVPGSEVTEEEVDQSIDSLREQQADFPDVTPARPLAMGDYAVVDYDGTIEGEPVHVKFPKAGKPLSHNKDFWIKMTDEAFFPGYCAQLTGMNIGETREFDITVPDDFPVEGMPGTKIHYKVTLRGVKTRTLPELNDEFANSVSKGKTLAELRTLAREELVRQKVARVEAAKRTASMAHLTSKVECELPTSLVRRQTQSILDDIVRENQERGVADDILREHEQELVGSAAQSARERIKGTFILLRIAEKEGLTVTEMDLRRRISALAQRARMAFDKMVKELQKRNAIDQIRDEILTAKALDLVASQVTITTETPSSAADSSAAASGTAKE
jgi:trigger factor